MATKKFIERVCESGCAGTGVYSGFAEPKGVAVVCFACDGTGREKISYTPFTARKVTRGIKTVRTSQGTFIATGVGPIGGSVTYKEFLAGKFPKVPKAAKA